MFLVIIFFSSLACAVHRGLSVSIYCLVSYLALQSPLRRGIPACHAVFWGLPGGSVLTAFINLMRQSTAAHEVALPSLQAEPSPSTAIQETNLSFTTCNTTQDPLLHPGRSHLAQDQNRLHFWCKTGALVWLAETLSTKKLRSS